MQKFILDLHIHSKYSRACSKELTLPNIAKYCEKKGIQVVVTGDFTHPAWAKHIREELVEDSGGIYRLKNHPSPTRFLLGTEVASIKKHAGQTRRVHHLLFAPSIEVAEKFTATLSDRGINLKADGRPIIGMTSKDILEVMLGVDDRMVMIPAHAWTPWFGVFGAKGGYRSLEECYEDLTPHIFAIETGLSSDALMNRRVSAIDHIALVSNSDAHSLDKLGREANVIALPDGATLTYEAIMSAIRTNTKETLANTIEFYPEEGKYHVDGHAICKFFCEPEETKRRGGMCPVCGKQLTIGVLHRVIDLADRTDTESASHIHIPEYHIVPLLEILSNVYRVGVKSKKVVATYEKMIHDIGNEFYILLHAPLEVIEKFSSDVIRMAVERVRTGKIVLKPGYDGVFGVVKVFDDGERIRPTQKSLLQE
jgi:uncharacterized protein (TIGR00375 family)